MMKNSKMNWFYAAIMLVMIVIIAQLGLTVLNVSTILILLVVMCVLILNAGWPTCILKAETMSVIVYEETYLFDFSGKLHLEPLKPGNYIFKRKRDIPYGYAFPGDWLYVSGTTLGKPEENLRANKRIEIKDLY